MRDLCAVLISVSEWVSFAASVGQFDRTEGEKMNTAIEAPETVESNNTKVSCDGGGDLGHPRVYLNMGDKGEVECPYCDRKFVLCGNK